MYSRASSPKGMRSSAGSPGAGRLVGWCLLLVVAMALAGCAPQPGLPPTPERETVYNDGASQQLAARWDAALATESPTLTVSEEELNAWLADNLGGTPVTAARLWITSAGLRVLADTSWRWPRRVDALAALAMRDGRPHLRLVAATADGVAVPRWVQRSLEHTVNALLADAEVPVQLDRITVTDGALHITGQRR